jgi:hypothetical protein
MKKRWKRNGKEMEKKWKRNGKEMKKGWKKKKMLLESFK